MLRPSDFHRLGLAFVLVSLSALSCGDDRSGDRFLLSPIDESADVSLENLAPLRYVLSPEVPAGGLEPLVFHFGGPGSSAVEDLPSVLQNLPAALRERYYFVALDEIGISPPTRYRCDSPDLRRDDAPEELLRNSELFAQECPARSPFVAQSDTSRYARDLERLRVELGESRLNFMGYSYGSAVALTYAALYPDRTGKVVLDSPLDVTLDFNAWIADQNDARVAATERYLAWCRSDPDCSVTAQTLNRFWTSVREQGSVEEQDAFISVFFLILVFQPNWPFLEDILNTADRNFNVLLEIADDLGAGAIDLSFFAATACGDSSPYTAEEIQARRETFLGGFESDVDVGIFDDYSISYVCLPWPIRAPPIDWDAALAQIDEDLDVLVINSTGDTQTPQMWSERIRARVPSARALTIDEVSHAVTFLGVNPCLDDATTEFLLGQELSENTCPRSRLPALGGTALVSSVEHLKRALRAIRTQRF
ncbi:MAG: alpha/beta fold hydrolase [Myxococcota bacterium]